MRFSSSYLLHHGADLSSVNGSKGLGGSEALDGGEGWVGQVGTQKMGDWSDAGWVDHDCEK